MKLEINKIVTLGNDAFVSFSHPSKAFSGTVVRLSALNCCKESSPLKTPTISLLETETRELREIFVRFVHPSKILKSILSIESDSKLVKALQL